MVGMNPTRRDAIRTLLYAIDDRDLWVTTGSHGDRIAAEGSDGWGACILRDEKHFRLRIEQGMMVVYESSIDSSSSLFRDLVSIWNRNAPPVVEPIDELVDLLRHAADAFRYAPYGPPGEPFKFTMKVMSKDGLHDELMGKGIKLTVEVDPELVKTRPDALERTLGHAIGGVFSQDYNIHSTRVEIAPYPLPTEMP